MKLAGAKLVVRRAPGFDPTRTCFLLINHVNLFDPFVLYATIRNSFAVWSLNRTSHSRLRLDDETLRQRPRAGQQPPFRPETHVRLTRAALDSGVSLAVFPEGQRTLDGRLGPFKDGVFRMAMKLARPSSGQHGRRVRIQQEDRLASASGTITVYLHDVIETKDLRKGRFLRARDRVHTIIARPMEEGLETARKQETGI